MIVGCANSQLHNGRPNGTERLHQWRFRSGHACSKGYRRLARYTQIDRDVQNATGGRVFGPAIRGHFCWFGDSGHDPDYPPDPKLSADTRPHFRSGCNQAGSHRLDQTPHYLCAPWHHGNSSACNGVLVLCDEGKTCQGSDDRQSDLGESGRWSAHTRY